jgi:D-inositol-3-phosphate glycosyltransferase
MRIALISEHASPLAALGGADAGGQNIHVAELSTALAAQGHDVRVYTRRDAEDLALIVTVADGISVVHVPAGPPAPIAKDRLLPYMGAFADWLAADWAGVWTPEVVHAHFWMSGLAAVGAARRIGVPVVQTYHALGVVKRRHQGAQDTSPSRRIGYESALGRTVDLVVAQCQDELRELRRLGVPPARTALVPSGVDVTRFRPDGPTVTRDGPRVLGVGRLVDRKGFADLIRAMPLVPAAECVIIGGRRGADAAADPHARDLLAIAERHGVADRVRLVGAVPAEETPAWYRSADVLAAVPWYEPFGLTALEAMACGVPVVASDVGGLSDTVIDGVTGVHVPPRDPVTLGGALRRLLADPARRFAYGSAAQDRVRSCYTWERAAQQLSELYATVAGLPATAVA